MWWSLAPRSQPSQSGLPGIVRLVDQADRQWIDSTRLPSFEAIDVAEIAAGTGGGPMPAEMRATLLRLSLSNAANECYVNAVLMAELWSCCMDSNFAWHTTGAWRKPLLQLLEQGPEIQWLTDHGCLGRLLTRWLVFQNEGCQHDAAECTGWFRQAFHQSSYIDVLQAPRWKSRCEISIEDREWPVHPSFWEQKRPEAIPCRILLSCGTPNHLFDMVLWVQLPRSVFRSTDSLPLAFDPNPPVRWNRQAVRLPCFMRTSGCTVQCPEFVAVAIILHRGEEPQCRHYQSVLRAGRGCFLTDDGRSPMACAHNEEMDKDIYLTWMTSATALTPMYGRIVEQQPNPFVPSFRTS